MKYHSSTLLWETSTSLLELNTEKRRQTSQFLECVEENFRDSLPGSGSARPAICKQRGTGGRHGGQNAHLGNRHKMIKFLTLGEVRRGLNKISVLYFQKTDFVLFMGLIQKFPWEAALKTEVVQESGHISIILILSVSVKNNTFIYIFIYIFVNALLSK